MTISPISLAFEKSKKERKIIKKLAEDVSNDLYFYNYKNPKEVEEEELWSKKL